MRSIEYLLQLCKEVSCTGRQNEAHVSDEPIKSVCVSVWNESFICVWCYEYEIVPPVSINYIEMASDDTLTQNNPWPPSIPFLTYKQEIRFILSIYWYKLFIYSKKKRFALETNQTNDAKKNE